MGDDSKDRPDDGPAHLPSLEEIEAALAAEDAEADEPADSTPTTEVSPVVTAEPRPAPNWGIDDYATKLVMPPVRRLVLPVLLIALAFAAAFYLLADAPRPDADDVGYAALVDYVEHVTANGVDAPLPTDLAASLSTALRGTAADGSVRVSTRGARGCWSVLLPAELTAAEPGGFVGEPPRPLLVDADTCR